MILWILMLLISDPAKAANQASSYLQDVRITSNTATSNVSGSVVVSTGQIKAYQGDGWSMTVFPSTQPFTNVISTGQITGVLAVSSSSVGSDTFFNSALSNSATAVKTISGSLYGYHIYNPNASLAFIQFFDLATGNVTLGTTVPKMSIALPSTANGTIAIDSFFGANPIQFSTAITIAATTTATGSTAPGTGLVVNVIYK